MVYGVNNTDIMFVVFVLLCIFAYVKKELVLQLLFDDDDDITATSSGSRDIVEVLKANKKNYLVLYASQTGTAEDYAKKFSKELAAKFSLNVMCADVENYDFESLNELPSNIMVSVFISTYGEGDFPDGAVQFEDFLSNAAPDGLSNVTFTLFGLGNSTYEFFNGAGRKALKCFQEAGATLVGNLGEADDGAGTTDEDYLSWKEATIEVLKDKLQLDEHEQLFEPSFKHETLTEINGKVSLGEPSYQYLPSSSLSFNSENIQLGPYDISHPYVAPVTKSYELFKSGDRNCVHVEFDVSRSNLKYTTGDHLAVWPSNANEKVEKFLEVFNLDPDTIFDLKPLDSTVKIPFPCPTTIGAAVRYYLEITGPVSRQMFSTLLQFAPNEGIKNKLAVLSKDKEKFAKEITSNCYDLADALLYLSKGTKWTSIKWQFLVETIPHLQPRYYSISSSASMEKQTIHITAVVENSPNPRADGPPVVGVATNLLRNIQMSQAKEDLSTLPVHFDLKGPRNLFADYKLPVHVRRSTFRLPNNPATPVIMVGPGTGVAPFRGFIRERVASMSKQNGTTKLGKHLLFYGSRNSDDFLYEDEWPDYAKKLDGSFEMVVCHSRLPGKPKVYVQDKLREYQDELLKLLDAGAFIYVCGDAKNMAQGVHAALVEVLAKGKNIEEVDATQMIKMLKTTGRYQEDIW